MMTANAAQRFRTSEVVRMFPTFVWKADLDPETYGPLNDAIMRALADIGAPLADLNSGESWQSDHDLHERKPFAGLVGCIDAAAECVLAHLKVGHQGFRITGCWANVNAPGAGHRVHSHPNNYLSGVYYVRAHQGADSIGFLDPRPQTGIVRPPVTELTAENTEEVVLKVRDGMLLMFPAWLQHGVDQNRSDGLRVSLGFNVMFRDYAEAMGRPPWAPGKRHSPAVEGRPPYRKA
jgi:uncharacterized protein (TIGR02466 family)